MFHFSNLGNNSSFPAMTTATVNNNGLSSASIIPFNQLQNVQSNASLAQLLVPLTANDCSGSNLSMNANCYPNSAQNYNCNQNGVLSMVAPQQFQLLQSALASQSLILSPIAWNLQSAPLVVSAPTSSTLPATAPATASARNPSKTSPAKRIQNPFTPSLPTLNTQPICRDQHAQKATPTPPRITAVPKNKNNPFSMALRAQKEGSTAHAKPSNVTSLTEVSSNHLVTRTQPAAASFGGLTMEDLLNAVAQSGALYNNNDANNHNGSVSSTVAMDSSQCGDATATATHSNMIPFSITANCKPADTHSHSHSASEQSVKDDCMTVSSRSVDTNSLQMEQDEHDEHETTNSSHGDKTAREVVIKHEDCGELKPYKCSYCVQRFRFRKQLLQHQSIHTGAQPFECRVCRKQFSTKASWQSHLSHKHT